MEVSCTFESNNTSELSVQESNVKKNRRRRKNLSNVETLKSTSKENQSLMIESKDVNLCLAPETMVEEPLKPRWILLPGESQRYKIRFQPEETGRYEETYAVTIAEGNCITYDINVIGVADVPRLDMNPDTIFMKVIKPYLIILPKSDIARFFQTMATKLHATDNSVYFYDTETYDFGSQLLFHQDQKFVNTFSITFFYLSSFNNRTTNDSHEERLLLIIIGSVFLLRNLYYNYPVSQFERGEINRNKLSVERTDSAPISIQGNSKSKGIERSAPSLRIC